MINDRSSHHRSHMKDKLKLDAMQECKKNLEVIRESYFRISLSKVKTHMQGSMESGLLGWAVCPSSCHALLRFITCSENSDSSGRLVVNGSSASGLNAYELHEASSSA
ncbi:MAG: hypothetical protein SGPRY_004789 [Prymnesium sp.]